MLRVEEQGALAHVGLRLLELAGRLVDLRLHLGGKRGNVLGLGLCRGEAGIRRFDLRRERGETALELLALLLEVGQLGFRGLELLVGRFLLLVELGEVVGAALLGPGARRQGRRHRRERDRGREEVMVEPPHAQQRRQHVPHKQHRPHP